ncbi:MAG: tripartite tricarboxylate transporter TctB family protein [Spirochaetia bacterium]|nr:tripartite tricarboxylate transporter TctB family protein [Spirochaetia bacterium]
MKKSDIILTVAIYIITAFFFAMVMQYEPAVRIYPCFVMGVLFVLNTIYLIKCMIVFAKEKKIENDFAEMFKDFEIRQYLFVFFASLAYVVLICLAGFYIATLIYLTGVLKFLKVPVKYILITVVVFGCIIYGAFSQFLHVPLPAGLLG